MNKQELKDRTKKFALDVIKMCEELPAVYLGKHVNGQLIRSASSVAANYRAACLAQLKAAYIAKLSIVIEEADESEFWLEVISETKLLVDNKVEELQREAHELASIFITSRKTLMQKK
ncbi:four helix bundle protein [Carboxylicivirga sp. A043]|uniref:four helix bundle protein n=1 Tax=Carboxylicivirga litoralis TaxID=2816963 RepID=UPI0021CB1045|nr:four helix bundle protein [Carboxylicivirga sp. A043]MCU4157420.1 four helix bundle protein [Carboxylicivirga sp. A043]